MSEAGSAPAPQLVECGRLDVVRTLPTSHGAGSTRGRSAGSTAGGSGRRYSSPRRSTRTDPCGRTERRSTPTATTTGGRLVTRSTLDGWSTGSCRTCAGSSVGMCSTSPLWSPSAGWPRMSTSRCAAPSRGPSCGRSPPRRTTRCGGRSAMRSSTTASCRPGTRIARHTSTREPVSRCDLG
jgi:hypothetical protein